MRALPEKYVTMAEIFFAMRKHKHSDRERALPEGWYKLGSGLYGEAWAHPDYPDLALKISGPAWWGFNHAPDVDPERHDAWPTYARHCQAHPHEHFPEIMHFVQASERMAWAIMPRYGKQFEITEDMARVRDVLWGEQSVEGEEYLWPLLQMISALGFNVDLHAGNFMLKEDGTFVITDPFSDPDNC